MKKKNNGRKKEKRKWFCFWRILAKTKKETDEQKINTHTEKNNANFNPHIYILYIYAHKTKTTHSNNKSTCMFILTSITFEFFNGNGGEKLLGSSSRWRGEKDVACETCVPSC